MASPRQRQLMFALFFGCFAVMTTVLSLSDAVPAFSKSVIHGFLEIGRFVEAVIPIDISRDDVPWRGDQIGHAGLWGVGMLGMGLGLRRRVGLLTTALVMVAAGFGFELAQGIFTATRSVSMTDGIGNVAGIVIATVVVAMVGPLVDKTIDGQAKNQRGQHKLVA